MLFKLDSSAFALLFIEISVTHTTEISVKSSAKADETSFRRLKVLILSFSDIFLINNGPVADS